MSELSNFYIQLKSQNSWKDELDKRIINRSKIFGIYDYLLISNKLLEELSQITTPYDSDFNEECKLCLINIRRKDDLKRKIILDELEISRESIIRKLRIYHNLVSIDDHKVTSILDGS